MKRLSILPVISLITVSLGAPHALAADARPVVAVFDVQAKRIKLTKAQRDLLTELLGQELGVGGVYQVMPPGDVKRALMEQSSSSYKACYDEKCQIQLGRQLPANKLATTTILKAAGKCRVATSLYDLARQTTDIVATEKGNCQEADFVGAIEKVAGKLRDFGRGGRAKPASDFVSEDLGEKPAGDWQVGGGGEVIVAFSSEPAGALVLVDNKMVCKETPCSRSVPKGKHLVSMQADKHVEKQQQVDLAAGSKVAWSLTPNHGFLTVRSEPAGLDVTVNGEPAGKTPLQRQERGPGVYRVLVASACHYDAGKKVKVARGQEETVSVALKEKQGAVKVSAKDRKGNDLVAEVFVDGKRLGTTPGTYKVSVCTKALEVRHKDHPTARQSLRIRERQVQAIALVLDDPAPACVGGQQLIGGRCMCPRGTRWDGKQCASETLVCHGGQHLVGGRCECPQGTRWDGKQCVSLARPCGRGMVTSGGKCFCREGQSWDGTQCVASNPRCKGGQILSGGRCMCARGTRWDGRMCVMQ